MDSSDDDDNDNKHCTLSWLYNCSMFNSQQCGYRITVILIYRSDKLKAVSKVTDKCQS